MGQHTVNLPCIADTYVDSEYRYTNYGNLAQAIVANKYYSPSITKTALLKFDKTLLPQHVNIIKTTLKLYVSHKVIGSGETPDVTHSTVSDFDELNVTYETVSGNPWPVIRDLAGVLTGQYQNFILNPNNYNIYTSIGLNLGIYDSYSYVSSMTFSTRESANPPILEVTYEIVPPSKPTLINPVGSYEVNSEIIRLSWNYISIVGGTQKGFNLQWSADQVTWSTISQTTANNYYDVPAGTFSSGNIYWKVQTINEYDETSEYSDIAAFYAIGAPDVAVINSVSTNTSRPVIEWTAFNQQVYQLQVLSGNNVIYDSGEKPSLAAREHKITTYLDDGTYTVRIRIKNEYDKWSMWGGASFTLSTVKPPKPELNLQRTAYGVELHIIGIADYALIYRSDYNSDNYICIGRTTDAAFIDYSVQNRAEYKYFARSVSEAETFQNSDIKFIQAEFRHSLIAPVSDLSKIFAFKRSLNTPPKKVYNRNVEGLLVNYSGRKCPVSEPSEHITVSLAVTFFLKTWSEVEKFIEVYDMKETVLYRDSKGRRLYGTLSNLSVNDERNGYNIGFVINIVDYKEGVGV